MRQVVGKWWLSAPSWRLLSTWSADPQAGSDGTEMGPCLLARDFPLRVDALWRLIPTPVFRPPGVGRDGDFRQGSGGTDTSPSVFYELFPLFPGSGGTETL